MCKEYVCDGIGRISEVGWYKLYELGAISTLRLRILHSSQERKYGCKDIGKHISFGIVSILLVELV